MNFKNKISVYFHINRWFISLITLLFCSSTYSQTMQFEKSIYDFGQVKMNTTQQHELRFKNTGEDTLVVLSEPKTASSTDVARIKDGKMKYAPNEEGAIIYQFDTKSSKNYNNIVTIQTQSAIAIRVKWEVLPDSINLLDWQDKIDAHPSFNKHIDSLTKNYCYLRSGHSLEMPMLNCYYGPCDSIRKIAVEELGGLFNSKELVNVFWQTDNYLVKLISFEALTRTSFKADSLAQLLDSFIVIYGKNYDYELLNHFLDIISPIKIVPFLIERYNKSTKVYLDDFLYLQYLLPAYSAPQVLYPGQALPIPWGITDDYFHVSQNTINFGTIDLSSFSKTEFVLRRKLRVYSTSDKLIIIAPYTDANTTCDKKSYRLKSKGAIEIDFSSVVKLKAGNQSIKRAIKIVDYQTKVSKTIWIEAYLINYKVK